MRASSREGENVCWWFSLVFSSASWEKQKLPTENRVLLLKEIKERSLCRRGQPSPRASLPMLPHWQLSLISYRWKVPWLKLPTLLLSSSSAPACSPHVPRNSGPCVPLAHMVTSIFLPNLPPAQAPARATCSVSP